MSYAKEESESAPQQTYINPIFHTFLIKSDFPYKLSRKTTILEPLCVIIMQICSYLNRTAEQVQHHMSNINFQSHHVM